MLPRPPARPQARQRQAAATAAAGGEELPGLGTLLVDLNVLLQDSFLRRASTAFFSMLHEERGRVGGELAAAAGAASELLSRELGWGVGVVTELGGSEDEDEDAPVLVLEGEAGF